MRKSVLQALGADAFRQVLDNGVFRILAVLTALPILFTFVVGLREDGIVLLYGLKTWSYADVLGGFGSSSAADPRGFAIEFVLQVVFQFLAGDVGMILCLTATAFFVPRLIEKGSAELYFHKPVSRAWLYLSRYVAGLVFVALIAVVLVGGMFLGLWIVSGHRDPGILAAALDLVYVFALIHPVAMAAGALTRSTVAAILLSVLFFLFNGCVQLRWINAQGPRVERHDEPADEEGTARRESDATEEREASGVESFLGETLEVLHYALPKTSDAAYFTQKLRKALAPPEFRDDDSLVSLGSLPEGCARRAPEPAGDDAPRALLGEPRLALDGPGGTRYALFRRPLEHTESRVGERVHPREESTSQAGKKLEEWARAAGHAAITRDAAHFGRGFGATRFDGTLVGWQQVSATETRTRSAVVFRGTDHDFLYTLWVDSPGALSPEAAQAERERLASQLQKDLGAAEDWYPRQLGITAPLRYNVLFSIGSSLAFVVLLLGLGAWRLERIDF